MDRITHEDCNDEGSAGSLNAVVNGWSDTPEASGDDRQTETMSPPGNAESPEEVAGSGSLMEDRGDHEVSGEGTMRNLTEVCLPLGRRSSPEAREAYLAPTASRLDYPSNYLPPPFGEPDDQEPEDDMESPYDRYPHGSPHSRVNVQFSPVSSECSDLTSSMAMSDCSGLGATGYSTDYSIVNTVMDLPHDQSPPKLLKSSPEDGGTAAAIVVGVQEVGPQPHHRRRKTVQIADPDTYQSFPSSVDNAEYGPFGDYGSLSDVDFVDVNSNELNNNTIQMDNANVRDQRGINNRLPPTPPPHPQAVPPNCDEAYYDTVSSTSSTSGLLKRVARDSGQVDPSDFLGAKLGADVDLKLGQLLLNKTLEQVKRSLEEISPTLDTVIAPIGSSAKLMHTYLKNLVMLSVGFMFSFVAFFSLRNLQSSINHTAGLGLASMACMYATFIIGCLTATSVIQRIRPKFSILLFLVGNLVFIGANFYPSFYTMLPATALLGLCQAYLWVAQGTYLTSIAVSYAVAARKRPEHILGLFNGFFLFLLQIAQIFGNLISSSVFSFVVQNSKNTELPVVYLNKSATANVRIMKSNQSMRDGDVDSYQFYISAVYSKKEHQFDTAICGASYCHAYPIYNDTTDIDYSTIALLLTIFSVLTSIGMIIIGFGLDRLDVIFHKSKLGLGQQLCSIGKIHGNIKLLLCMTLMIFLGMEEAFMYGEVTKAFITCPLGVHMVGYVMMCFGGCNAIGSFIIGQIQRCVHRIVIFSIGAITYACILCVMLLWLPSNDDYAFVFLLAGALGFSDALWQTQICSLVGILFPSSKREAAFASLRMYESVGFCIAFGYAQFLCMDIKMFILGGVLLFGMTNYFVMEFCIGRNSADKSSSFPSIDV